MKPDKVRLLDRQLSRFLAEQSLLSGSEKSAFKELVCRLSTALAGGDSCLPLSARETGLVERSGLSGEGNFPLAVFAGHLYLQRFLLYEKQLARKINAMSAGVPLIGDDNFIEKLFPGQAKDDLQRVAAEAALKKNFLIISGGPGTGKTTTVLKILALLQNASPVKLHIALAAPTGKAAMRLQESIAANMDKLPIDDRAKADLEVKASTLHRLLGVKRFSPFFRHNRDKTLLCDVLVVDEASMVDLPLMSKLVDALRPGCRLILLGDKNQLASVESGTVLADMMKALPACTVELLKSYRFDEDIKRFAEAINKGMAEDAWQIVSSGQVGHISLLEEDIATYGGARYLSYMQDAAKVNSVEDLRKLFSLLRSFSILCAVRQGIRGINGINAQVEQYLTTHGYDCLAEKWYVGRPVMISRNEYSLDLYNGDVGICMPDPAAPDTLKVWFERPDGTLQGILPGRLPHCETVYALTIHKSQGTEVDDVLVVLPEKETALITRELLYTAVTRAGKSVKIASSGAAFRAAVNSRIQRAGGLAKLLLLERTTTPARGEGEQGQSRRSCKPC